jgi:amidohydrolase
VKERILAALDQLEGKILGISRQLHARPELSLEETESSSMLRNLLAEEGFHVESGVAGLDTAFVATRGADGASPRVAFLAEYDALPDIGHGCGHNLIAAAGVGAGLVLSRAVGEQLEGKILVIGTPAEETIGGKVVMVREGIFEGLDAALMIHPSAEWRVFTDSLACASMEYTFIGKASHAVAWPEKGINALDALIQLFLAVDMLRKRLGREVRMPGIIREGGTRPNIIPARAVGSFSLRAPTTVNLTYVKGEVERAAHAIAESTGCQLEVRQTDNTYDDMLTNEVLARRFKAHLSEMGIETVDSPRSNKGSLDMGNVSRVVPSIHPMIRVAGPETPLHSAGFAEATTSPEAETSLLQAVRALALTGGDALRDSTLRAEASREFSEKNPERGIS